MHLLIYTNYAYIESENSNNNGIMKLLFQFINVTSIALYWPQESSHDSAYNGGMSSSAESRGPTPVVMCPTAKGVTLNRSQLQR
jgi:hypothetical protein